MLIYESYTNRLTRRKICNFLTNYLWNFFESVSDVIKIFMAGTQTLLLSLPPIIFVLILALLAFVLANWKVALFTFTSSVFVFYTGMQKLLLI